MGAASPRAVDSSWIHHTCKRLIKGTAGTIVIGRMRKQTETKSEGSRSAQEKKTLETRLSTVQRGSRQAEALRSGCDQGFSEGGALSINVASFNEWQRSEVQTILL